MRGWRGGGKAVIKVVRGAGKWRRGLEVGGGEARGEVGGGGGEKGGGGMR